MSMPGKQARVLCPVCAEPMPPDETECANCGAFVIDEAVVRLSRAFGLDREKALKLFEAGFRHTKQLRDRDPDGILEKGEVGLLFICTNCGGFVAAGDTKCPRCAAEFESEPEPGPEEDILDLVLCPTCGGDNDPELEECEICGTAVRVRKEPSRVAPEASPAPPQISSLRPVSRVLDKVDEFLRDLRPLVSQLPRPDAPRPAAAPKPSDVTVKTPVAAPKPATASPANKLESTPAPSPMPVPSRPASPAAALRCVALGCGDRPHRERPVLARFANRRQCRGRPPGPRGSAVRWGHEGPGARSPSDPPGHRQCDSNHRSGHRDGRRSGVRAEPAMDRRHRGCHAMARGACGRRNPPPQLRVDPPSAADPCRAGPGAQGLRTVARGLRSRDHHGTPS